MGIFKNADDVYKYVGGVFNQGVSDPELGPKFAESGVTLRITYTDPDSVITVDFPNGKVYTGVDVGPDPNVELFMSADSGNKFWLGNLNLPAGAALELQANALTLGGAAAASLDGTISGTDFGVKRAVDEFVLAQKLTVIASLELDYPSWFIVKP